MKKLFKSMIVALLLTSLFTFLPFEKNCRDISDEVFRIHILADSDSPEDQSLKLKVRDAVLEYTDNLYSHVTSKEEAIEVTYDNLNGIVSSAESVLRSKGCDQKVKAEICNMDFNTRYYGDITMPSGNYTALRLTIGSGQGKNWWCVMYPSLCLYTASDAKSLKDELTEEQYEVITDTPKFEFKFKILEYFDYFCNLFG